MKIRTKEGKWLASSLFSEEARKFREKGYYCRDPWGSPNWMSYWEEQRRRCIEGYSIFDDEGNEHKITGHHYHYLNFTEIQIVVEDAEDEDSAVAEKETRPPDFWDGDYDYFWSIEIARYGLFTKRSAVPSTEEERNLYRQYQKELRIIRKADKKNYKRNSKYIEIKKKRDEVSQKVLDRLGLRVKPHLDYVDGGYHIIVGKARRKGYSFKNGAICANVYNTVREAQIVIGAFESKYLYPKGTMAMASRFLDYMNEHTGWRKSRDYVNQQAHKRASYKSVENGVDVEKGYLSEIFAITFKDKPDAARGKDGKIVLLEEAGAFPNLKDSFNAIYPALTGGSYITGQIFVFGTGGDMESGTVDYADMFYNPIPYRLMPFVNIWDENAENTVCGFFHPVTWNMEGFYDEQGNSDVEGALEFELDRRQNILENSDSSTVYQKHIQEFSLSPSEAFLTVSTNDFPVVELRNQLNKVIREGLMRIKGTPVTLSRNSESGKVEAKPDLNNELSPIIHYKVKQADLSGSPIIYEFPQPNPPKGLYKIGFDPYRQDQSQGNSLAAIYVYKGVQRDNFTRDMIVASYVGRPSTTDSVNRIAELLAELYNAEIMYENEVPDVKTYFERRRKLHLLAAQPDAVISKNIKNSKVARIYGCHMNDRLKDAGAKYIKKWLLQERDFNENGEKLTNIDYIYDIGLLEELILFDLKGNFDRVMSLMMVMFQIEEEEEMKEYAQSNAGSNVQDLLDLTDKLFKK